MGRTLGEVLDGLPPERLERIEARYREIKAARECTLARHARTSIRASTKASAGPNVACPLDPGNGKESDR